MTPKKPMSTAWPLSLVTKSLQHRIKAVTYLRQDTANSPMDCDCGWSGLSSEWDKHRLTKVAPS